MHRPRVRDASAVQGVYLTIGLSIAAFFPFLALYLRDAHGLDESQIRQIGRASCRERV